MVEVRRAAAGPDTDIPETVMQIVSSTREAGPGTAGRADPGRESLEHLRRFTRAAAVAIHAYPGPVGELLHREILTHIELGYRFLDVNALVPRIVDDLLEDSGGEPGPPDGPSRAVSPTAPARTRHGPGPREVYCFEV